MQYTWFLRRHHHILFLPSWLVAYKYTMQAMFQARHTPIQTVVTAGSMFPTISSMVTTLDALSRVYCVYRPLGRSTNLPFSVPTHHTLSARAPIPPAKLHPFPRQKNEYCPWRIAAVHYRHPQDDTDTRYSLITTRRYCTTVALLSLRSFRSFLPYHQAG